MKNALAILILLASTCFGTIVSSVYTLDGAAQKDGRTGVTEVHIDQFGGKYSIYYLAEPGVDYNAVMLARVGNLNDTLVNSEVIVNVSQVTESDSPSPTFNHCTKLQLAQALRAIYKDPTTPHWKIIAIGKYVNVLVVNGDVTDAQMKAAFNINDAQLATLKTKLSNQASIYDSVIATQGQ